MDSSEEIDTDDETAPPTLKEDVLFDLLQNNRRRALLRHLDDHGELQLSEIAKLIAAEESDIDPSQVTENSARSVYISLYQTHVPKLAEHNVVDYDRASSTVNLQPAAGQLLSHIHLDECRNYEHKNCESNWLDLFERFFKG